MKNDVTRNPDAKEELISSMGKKSTDRTKFRSVLSLYDEAVNKGSDRAGAYANRAIALALGIHSRELDATDIKKCQSDVEEALKINKDLAIVHIAEGCYYHYCVKDSGKAIASFNNASAIDPEGYKSLFYLAMVYKAMGNWHELGLLLKRIKKFKIQNPLSLTNIGICHEYLHDFETAVEYHQKAIDINPKWEAAYLNLLSAMILQGSKTSEARKVLNKLSGTTGEEYIEYLIMLDLYDGKYKEAFSRAKDSVSCDFTCIGERSLYLGDISKLLDDNVNAEKYYNCSLNELDLELNADTGNSEIRSLKALALAGRGNKIAAVEEGEKAVDFAKKTGNKILESEREINLAQIYSKLGMVREAIEKIDHLLNNPSAFSAKILLIDPVWRPLLDTPELKKIISANNNRALTL